MQTPELSNRHALAFCKVVLAAALTASCSGKAAPTITDPAAFLVAWVCPSGAPELIEQGCSGARPMQAKDRRTLRPHDLPGRNIGPEAWISGDSWTMPDGRFASIYAFAPWREWTPPRDGGEIYAVDGDRARAVSTQDGGKPYLQIFQGPECGGDGWALFWNDAPTGRWAARVARLSDGPPGAACAPLAGAYTRYRLETVDVRLMIDGAPTTRRIRTVISQHFDHPTIGGSQAMEEFYLGERVGRYRWSSYTVEPPAGHDLDLRCPTRPFTGVPEDRRFQLNDCRDFTNFRTHGGAFRGERYGWPS